MTTTNHGTSIPTNDDIRGEYCPRCGTEVRRHVHGPAAAYCARCDLSFTVGGTPRCEAVSTDAGGNEQRCKYIVEKHSPNFHLSASGLQWPVTSRCPDCPNYAPSTVNEFCDAHASPPRFVMDFCKCRAEDGPTYTSGPDERLLCSRCGLPSEDVPYFNEPYPIAPRTARERMLIRKFAAFIAMQWDDVSREDIDRLTDLFLRTAPRAP